MMPTLRTTPNERHCAWLLFLMVVIFTLLAIGCAPAPAVLRSNVAQLRGLAEEADQIHKQKCGPRAEPFPPSTTGGEPLATLPPQCGPLESCAHQAQAAAHACQDGIDVAMRGVDDATYAAQAQVCQVATRQAVATCQTARVH